MTNSIEEEIPEVQINEEEVVDIIDEDLKDVTKDPFNLHFWHNPESLPQFDPSTKLLEIEDDILGYHKRHNSPPKQLSPEDSIPHLIPFLRNRVLSSFEKSLLSNVSNYEDILYTRRTFDKADSIRTVYCMHALNHAFKARQINLRNNEKEKKLERVEDHMRDQAYHRAKVLILLPTRDAAYRTIKCLSNLMPPGSSVSFKNRIEKEYGPADPEEEARRQSAPPNGRRPIEHRTWFAGDTDDHFRIGIGIAKKTLKMFTPFEESDIIMASTLGLKTIFDGKDNDEQDGFFLSSIEVCIVDQACMLLMQNWMNLIEIMNRLNQRPKRLSKHTNLLRCREWVLQGLGNLYRQTVIFSSICPPLITGLAKYLTNYSGMVFFPPTLSASQAPFGGLPPKRLQELGPVSLQTSQLKIDLIDFQVPSVKDYSAVSQARFKNFERRWLPRLRRGTDKKGVLLYVPDYFDLMMIFELLKKENLDICCINEYTKHEKAERFRTLFYQGRIRVLIYSERYHFFYRRRVKGIHSLFFYGPPSFPHFLSELCDQATPMKSSSKSADDVTPITLQLLYHPETDAILMSQCFGHTAINKIASL